MSCDPLSTRYPHPVLEIGGTHVTAAVVGPGPEPDIRDLERVPLDPGGGRDELLSAFGDAAARLAAPPGRTWGVAVPGPFDLERGIGRYRDVGKFDSLADVDVGTALRRRLGVRPGALAFLNDADAFVLGEWVAGAAVGRTSAVGITLGTGVGSAFLRDGQVVDHGPQVPPQGSVHLLAHRGRPLEDWFSRRAIRAAFATATRGHAERVDVAEIAQLARDGDVVAAGVLRDATHTLATCLAPWLERFAPDVVVVGGSMSRSFDLLGPWLEAGLAARSSSLRHTDVVAARRPDHAPLVGAAWHASLQRADPG